MFIATRAIAAMLVCIFEHVQRRWALNDRLAAGDRSGAGSPFLFFI
jgi:hypothetical protein